MKKFFRWLGFVVTGLAGIVAVFAAFCYFASEHELTRTYTARPAASLAIPTDAASIASGERRARIGGCFACHGNRLQGMTTVDIPNVARFFSPNITKLAREYSDAELVVLMRQGIKRDGTSVFFMPSEQFRHLNDAELAEVLAWLRSMPVVDGPEDHTEVRPLGRMIVATGQFKTAAAQIQDPAAQSAATEVTDTVSLGRHLVMSSCSECHGQDLNGVPAAKSPPLIVAKGYSSEQFARLMHDGVGVGERTFELMTPTAKERFSYLTADEVAAIYAYLQSRS